MSKILLVHWSANFAMDDEHEKSRMKANESASLSYPWNLGSKELPMEESMQLVEGKIVDVEYNNVEWVDLAWGRRTYLDLHLNEEPMEGNDVDGQPTQIVKLPHAHEYAQIKFCSGASFKVFSYRCDEHEIFYG